MSFEQARTFEVEWKCGPLREEDTDTSFRSKGQNPPGGFAGTVEVSYMLFEKAGTMSRRMRYDKSDSTSRHRVVQRDLFETDTKGIESQPHVNLINIAEMGV